MVMKWFAASMIELFMLDLVMLMICLFQNLIMQLPIYSANGVTTQSEPTISTLDSSLFCRNFRAFSLMYYCSSMCFQTK